MANLAGVCGGTPADRIAKKFPPAQLPLLYSNVWWNNLFTNMVTVKGEHIELPRSNNKCYNWNFRVFHDVFSSKVTDNLLIPGQ